MSELRRRQDEAALRQVALSAAVGKWMDAFAQDLPGIGTGDLFPDSTEEIEDFLRLHAEGRTYAPEVIDSVIVERVPTRRLRRRGEPSKVERRLRRTSAWLIGQALIDWAPTGLERVVQGHSLYLTVDGHLSIEVLFDPDRHTHVPKTSDWDDLVRKHLGENALSATGYVRLIERPLYIALVRYLLRGEDGTISFAYGEDGVVGGSMLKALSFYC